MRSLYDRWAHRTRPGHLLIRAGDLANQPWCAELRWVANHGRDWLATLVVIRQELVLTRRNLPLASCKCALADPECWRQLEQVLIEAELLTPE